MEAESICLWTWIGDQWSKTAGCLHDPPEACGEPPFRGSFIGQEATTACTS